MLLYAAISGGILLDKNNITLWTEFEDIISKLSDDQDNAPSCDHYKNKKQRGYRTNINKRISNYHYGSGGCDCKVGNNIIDLGSHHYPRYLMNAVCEDNSESSSGICPHRSNCKPIEYNVSVLTVKNKKNYLIESKKSYPVPQMLRSRFKFDVVTVIAGCVCS